MKVFVGFQISAFGADQIVITDDSGIDPNLNIGFNNRDRTPIVGLSPDSNFRTSKPSIVPLRLGDIPLYIVEGIGLTEQDCDGYCPCPVYGYLARWH